MKLTSLVAFVVLLALGTPVSWAVKGGGKGESEPLGPSRALRADLEAIFPRVRPLVPNFLLFGLFSLSHHFGLLLFNFLNVCLRAF